MIFRYVFIIICFIFVIPASAYVFEADGLYYNIVNSTDVSITYKRSYTYNDYSGDVVIPETVSYNDKTYTVTSIGFSAFNSCAKLTSVSIPQTVISIGNTAFYGCTAITSISIPSSVIKIDDYAFTGCTSLKEIRLEDSSETLILSFGGNQKGLFYDCPLETVYLGRDITYETGIYFGHSPFYGIRTLDEVTLGPNVTTIGEKLFSDCTALTGIIIPDSVYAIYDKAFAGCTYLILVVIPESVTYIGNYAFQGCSYLTDFYVEAATPLNINANVFDKVDCSYTNLHVPAGSVEAYARHSVWGRFNIVAIETGIDETPADIDADSEIYYNLQGIPVSNPRPGNIYIHNGKKTKYS